MGVKFELFGRLKSKPQHKVHPSSYSSYSPSVVGADKINSPRIIAEKMLKQGKSEEEVRMYLKQRGFDFHDIEDAINYAIKQKISEGSTTPKPPLPSSVSSNANNSAPSTFSDSTTLNTLKAMLQEPETDEDVFLEELEELVDTIIEAKYHTLTSLPQEFHDLQQQITQEISELKKSREKESSEISNKLDKLDEQLEKHTALLEELEPRISAMENAFKDIIPRIIDDLRRVEQKMNLEVSKDLKDTKIFSFSDREKSKEEKSEEIIKEKEEETGEGDKEIPFKLDDLIS